MTGISTGLPVTCRQPRSGPTNVVFPAASPPELPRVDSRPAKIYRDTFHRATLQYERQYKDNACTAGDALGDTLFAVHRRPA